MVVSPPANTCIRGRVVFWRMGQCPTVTDVMFVVVVGCEVCYVLCVFGVLCVSAGVEIVWDVWNYLTLEPVPAFCVRGIFDGGS